MNNDPNHLRRDDKIAATPITSTDRRRFSPLWFLLLLLIPLLLLPFCHHQDADQPASATPSPTATALPTADTTSTANTPSPLSSTPTTNRASNPFARNTSGPDTGKAVLNFDVNATTPNAASTSTLDAVVAYLQANPNDRISLAGYTDNSGSADVNRQLTQQRVNNVKDALARAGVDANRISTANFGEAYPVTDNANPHARELNRRVEITLAK